MADVLADLPSEIQQHRILTTEKAAAFCGYDTEQWRRMYRRGDAPPPIRLSARKFGWKVGVLIAWINSKSSPDPEVAAA